MGAGINLYNYPPVGVAAKEDRQTCLLITMWCHKQAQLKDAAYF